MTRQTKTTMGNMISSLRKEHGMTQAELAEKMSVTDKAVSKYRFVFYNCQVGAGLRSGNPAGGLRFVAL